MSWTNLNSDVGYISKVADKIQDASLFEFQVNTT